MLIKCETCIYYVTPVVRGVLVGRVVRMARQPKKNAFLPGACQLLRLVDIRLIMRRGITACLCLLAGIGVFLIVRAYVYFVSVCFCSKICENHTVAPSSFAPVLLRYTALGVGMACWCSGRALCLLCLLCLLCNIRVAWWAVACLVGRCAPGLKRLNKLPAD